MHKTRGYSAAGHPREMLQMNGRSRTERITIMPPERFPRTRET